MLRAYFVLDPDEDGGIGVIAKNAKDAKSLGFSYLNTNMYSVEWINVRAHWIKDADITGMSEGVVSNFKDGVRKKIYGFLEDENCEVCGEKKTIQECNGKLVCGDCYDSTVLNAGEVV